MSKPRNQLPINTKIPTSSSSPQKNHPSQRKSYNCFNTKDLAAFHPNNSDREIPRKSSSWSTRRRMRRRRRRRIRSICGRNVIISSPENHRPRTKSPDKHQCPPLDSDYETCSSDSEYASNLPEYGSEHMPGSGSSTFDAMLSAACACSSASSTKCKATNDNKAGRRQLPDGLGRTGGRKSSGNCFAVVKLSRDPRGEFMQSMVEMIVENDIRGSKDLEELLVCYLSLNSQEYHNLIISVFKQIWFDLVIHLRRSRHM